MEEYLGKKVFLRVKINGNNLVYNATILNITPTHLTFRDKFDKRYTYLLSNIVEIKEEIGEHNGK